MNRATRTANRRRARIFISKSNSDRGFRMLHIASAQAIHRAGYESLGRLNEIGVAPYANVISPIPARSHAPAHSSSANPTVPS